MAISRDTAIVMAGIAAVIVLGGMAAKKQHEANVALNEYFENLANAANGNEQVQNTLQSSQETSHRLTFR